MSTLTQAIFDRLSNDGTLTAMLSLYNGRPAIFTQEDIPPAVQYPYIVSAGEVSNTPWRGKDYFGQMILRDIRCYDASIKGSKLIEDIADRIKALFRPDDELVFPPGSQLRTVMQETRGPIMAPTEQTSQGRVVTVHMIVTEDLAV